MGNLSEIKATLKTGKEVLSNEGINSKFSLLDFWKWSASDILSNATRGKFAEFIVGSALGIDFATLRDEWSSFDLETKEGIKIEVKSAAYIQSWFQKALSQIQFSIKESQNWDAKTGVYHKEICRSADVYVFCLLKHKEQKTINPMKLEQWEFYVLPTIMLDNYTRSKSSITLSSLIKLTDSKNYAELKEAIETAFLRQNSKH